MFATAPAHPNDGKTRVAARAESCRTFEISFRTNGATAMAGSLHSKMTIKRVLFGALGALSLLAG